MVKLTANPRPLAIGMKGQNYMLHGCMEYLCECLGLGKDYNYWFFSDVTGDSFTQLYSRKIGVTAWCYTHNCFDETILRRAFDACGYGYEYKKGDHLYEKYLPQIRESIDRGIPVISRGGKDTWEFNIICGYDEEGNLYYLLGENAEPRIYPNQFNELIFAGGKKELPPIADVYRTAVMAIPSYIAMPPTEHYSFGKQAFIDWAQSFQNGTYDNIPPERISPWEAHGTYLCIIGTNGCAVGALEKALRLNPDMRFIKELLPLYHRKAELFHILAYRNADNVNDYANGGMHGGFNIKKETIKDKDLMKGISGVIMEAAELCDQILEIIASCQ